MAAAKKKVSRKRNGTSVAKKQSTNVSADVIDIGSYLGMGNEEVQAEDYALPILRILQKMSPQVDENDEGYIKGAKSGMFFNTVTNECYDGPITVLPVLFRKELIEWIPRDSGGGFVKAYEANDPIKGLAVPKEEGSRHMMLPESGNDLVDTYNQYVLCVTENGEQFSALVSMTSTQVKKSRQWNSLISQNTIEYKGKFVVPPRWTFGYHLNTIGEKNDFGSFYNFQITVVKDKKGKMVRNDLENKEWFIKAHALYEALVSGKAKANYDADAKNEGETSDDIPF